jgi:hypothetical protein
MTFPEVLTDKSAENIQGVRTLSRNILYKESWTRRPASTDNPNAGRYGFLEAPYRKVEHRSGKSFVTDEIHYLMADEEEDYYIAESTINLGKNDEILDHRLPGRHRQEIQA